MGQTKLKIECLINGQIETNTYFIISKDKRVLIVDPADGEKVFDFIKKNELIPEKIINTHGHYDHISGNQFIKNHFDIPICVGVLDYDYLLDPELNMSYYIGENYISPEAEILLDDNSKISFGGEIIDIVSTPGHTPGSISLIFDNKIVSGDLIFTEGIGRTDLAGGDPQKIIESVKKLFSKPNKESKIFPGHGLYGGLKMFKEVLNEFNIRS